MAFHAARAIGRVRPRATEASVREFAILVGALLVIGAGWGLGQPLYKIAVSDGYGPVGLVFWQLVIGAALAVSALGVLRRPIPLSRPAFRLYGTIALVGTLVPSSVTYVAAAHLPAGIIAILMSLVPMIAFPIALAMGLDRFGWARLAGLAAGLAGAGLIAFPEASLPERAMVAFIPVALIAPLFYALEGNLVARWSADGVDAIQIVAGASILGALIAGPAALASGQFIDPRGPWSAPDIALVVSASVDVAVYALYVWLIGRAGSVFAAQVSYLVMAFGVLWAMGLLGESYSVWVWWAMGAMIVGLFLVQPRPGPLAPPARTGDDSA